MNTIFIDVTEQKSKYFENKKSIKKRIINKFKNINIDFFKFNIVCDYINNNNANNKTMYLNFDINYFNNDLYSNKHKITKYITSRKLKNNFKNINELYIVFSKRIDENIEIKNYIKNIFNLNENIEINYISANNQMLKNDVKYIDDFIIENDIKPNKLKILTVINDVNDYNNDKMLEYISKYKFIDVLKTNSISKYDYKILNEKISDINNEYGTTIDIIQKRNIQDYNVYIMFSKINKQDFVTHYILQKDSKYVDMYDTDNDVLTSEIVEYEKSKYEINTILDRLNIDKNNFSTNKLGSWYKLEKNI